MEEEERSFERAFGVSVEEALRQERGVGEEEVKQRARTTETVPSEREVDEHNLDHGAFRS